jgi:tryptophan halogenase
MKKIKNIVIVGGGTAGWSTALNFLNKTIGTKITVVASKEIPIIGVGESTTGQMFNLINLKGGRIELDEQEFLEKTGSTFKIGILHKDWKKVGEYFTSPLGDEYVNVTNYPSFDYDFNRIYHVAHNLPFRDFTSQYMLNNKLPLMYIDEDNPYKFLMKGYLGRVNFMQGHLAYHLDTYKTGQFFKEKLLEHQDVNYIDDVVVDGKLDENGNLQNIITKSGLTVEGDLFVDCSGFKRVLIEKLFDNKFISYQDELLCNRALPFHLENKDDTQINNYTKVTAKKYGWLWDIPLQHRKGMGYVYCDEFITPDKAQEEIEKDLGVRITPQNDIKFNAGRLEKFWCKNVLSTGLSSAFVEPLEATSIHLTLIQINHFIEQFFTHRMDFNNSLIEKYNKDMTTIWDDIKDFIVLHYISKRKDTKFWIEASSEKRRSEHLKTKLEIWSKRMPRVSDYKGRLNDNFYHLGNTLWMQILIGMDLLDSKIALDELNDFKLYDFAKSEYDKRNHFTNHALSVSLNNNDFYKHELNNYKMYDKVWGNYNHG